MFKTNYNNREENRYNCICSNTIIPMWNGEIKLAKDIKVNDQLIGDDGLVRNVLKVTEGIGQMYDIIQENSETYRVNSNHILTLQTDQIFDIPIKIYMKFHDSLKQEIYGVYSKCVQWERKEVPFDPYFFGLWLGDCIISNCSYECYGGKKYIINHMVYEAGNTYNYNKTTFESLEEYIEKYDLIKNKYIPNEYIVNDSTIRLKVLAGILDKIGKIPPDKTKIIIPYKINERLENDIIKLSRTLGFLCNKTKYINIFGGNLNNIPTKLFTKYGCVYNNLYSTGHIEIKEVTIGNFIGFEIDGNQRFIINDFTVTHNCTNI